MLHFPPDSCWQIFNVTVVFHVISPYCYVKNKNEKKISSAGPRYSGKDGTMLAVCIFSKGIL